MGAAVALPGGCVPAGGSPRGRLCVVCAPCGAHAGPRRVSPHLARRMSDGLPTAACSGAERLRAAGRGARSAHLRAAAPSPPTHPHHSHAHTHPRLPLDADAERAEVVHQPPLDFGCTIMVLGLSGVGKTATINSLLGRQQPAGYRETGRVRSPAAWGPCPTHAGFGAAPGASWPAGWAVCGAWGGERPCCSAQGAVLLSGGSIPWPAMHGGARRYGRAPITCDTEPARRPLFRWRWCAARSTASR